MPRVLMLISTDLDFRVFQTQHFEPLDQQLVITRADPGRPRGDADQRRARGAGICPAARASSAPS